MSAAFIFCPQCGARAAADAPSCPACGVGLNSAPDRRPGRQSRQLPAAYDFRHGEDDLHESAAGGRARILSWLSLGCIVLCISGAAGLALRYRADEEARLAIPATATATLMRPDLPTITPGPPTVAPTSTPQPTDIPSPEPTRAPCIRRVAAGDSLIGIIAGCGHSSLEILPTVKAINGIVDETRIQIGAAIVVPWPQPTFDPEATAAPASADSLRAEGDDYGADLSLLSFDPFAPTATATLLPGLMWHRVQADENMILIALRYHTNAKTLSDLNPEIEFALCDFGMDSGGPECIVQLFQGQLMRVPAPTPTPTKVPSPTGRETATPSPSPTVNKPHALSPANQAFFGPQDQITLRWVATGALSPGEIYRVTLEERAAGVEYSADTRDLYFILPPRWQARDAERHTYTWRVSIVDEARGTVKQSTETMTLVWQGAGGSA